MNKIFNMFFLIAISVFILALLTYYLILSIDVYSIVAIIFLIIILLSLIIITIIQCIKTKMAIDKQEILLDFMKEYEMIIDKERIDRHEMVNNLLVLKSIKNKNSKNYNKLLDDILLAYQSNKTPKGLYELPSGLKGLFYYKIYDMKSNNIEPFVNVSNKIIKDLDNLDSKTLTKVCKILGILLDNAKEAAKESKEKLVVIDLYKENKDIVVYIENSINKNMEVDLSNIKVKGFSTKGNNRGYGLYLVDKILNKTDEMELIQKINNKKFISILTIKK
jgi:two-component system sensor histidine kinase AgrC